MGVLGSWYVALKERHRERTLSSVGLAPIPEEARKATTAAAGGVVAMSFRGATADLKDWVAESPGLEKAPSTTDGFAAVYLITHPEKRIRASVLIDYSAGQVMATIDANDSTPDDMRRAVICLAACLIGMIFMYGYELRRERDL